MNCIDAEHQKDQASQRFQLGENWIEIDHASDNVNEWPRIDEEVFDYFTLQVDPNDERNVWLQPTPGVELLGKEIYDDEADGSNSFSYKQRLLLPDGREAVLFYEDASTTGRARLQGEFRVVRIEVSNQPAFETMTWLGRQATRE